MSLDQVNGDSGSNPRLAEIRERLKLKLAETKEQRMLRKERLVYVQPRYDDVFFQGLEWLDSL